MMDEDGEDRDYLRSKNARGDKVVTSTKTRDFAALDRLPKRLRQAMVESSFDFSAEMMERILNEACGGDVSEAIWQLRMNEEEMLKPFRRFLQNPRKILFDNNGLPVYS
jgi:hypothetical protein